MRVLGVCDGVDCSAVGGGYEGGQGSMLGALGGVVGGVLMRVARP